MERVQLLKQSFWIMLRHPALWVISLFGSVVSFITVNAVVLDTSAASAMIRMVIAFLAIPFTSGALISMIDNLADGRTATVSDGLKAGLRRINQLVLVDLALMIPTWIILAVVSGSVLTIFTSELGQPGGFQAINAPAYLDLILSAGGLVILLIILSILITGVLGIGAKRAVMLEDQTVLAALRRGWRLLRIHLVDYVVVGLMMLGLIIALELLLGLTVGQIVSSMLPGQAQTGAADPTVFYTTPIGLAWIVLNMIIGALIEVFASGAWTLAYRQWQSQEREVASTSN